MQPRTLRRTVAWVLWMLASAPPALADAPGPVEIPHNAPAPAQPAGWLQPAGQFRFPRSGHTATVLGDGSVLVYGNSLGLILSLAQPQRAAALRARHHSGTMISGPEPEPTLWDPAGHGWRSLPYPPECPGRRFLHSATVLPDGRVLVGGGVCDRPQLANESLSREPHLQLTLWDPVRKAWQPAPALRHERLWHTASLLPDGSVLFVGGAADPALPPEPEAAAGARAEGAGDDAMDPALPPEPEAAAGAQAEDPGDDAVDPASRPAPEAGAGAQIEGSRFGAMDAASRLAREAAATARNEHSRADAMDPASHPLPAVAVTARVERFHAGAVTGLPPLHEARAGHAAVALADGSLLVAGGFNDAGHALASVELWQPSAQAWRPLPRLRTARYDFSATRLPDGRVVIAGGIGADGLPLRSTEVWDGAEWREGPTLPAATHGVIAVALADGSVLLADPLWRQVPYPTHQLWRWHPRWPAWRPAGRVRPANHAQWNSQVLTLVAQADGSALLFTADAVLRWWPEESGPAPEAPVWTSTPALAALPGDRVVAVGLVEDEQGWAWRARLWERATDRWSDAGASTMTGGMIATRALWLPAGRVLHAGVRGRELACETWAPGEDTWRSCTRARLETNGDAPVALAVLPDGNAAAMISTDEVLVFDTTAHAWTRVPVRRSSADLVYGTRVRMGRPLAELQDPRSGQWVDVSDLAARFWQGSHGRRAQVVDIGGATRRTVPGRASPASMLWDPRKREWAYVFEPLGAQAMGADAQYLPDGCALSTSPLAVFNPRDGQVQRLDDPGIGAAPAALLVLPDGTAVISGVAPLARDPGAGWLVRKASCAGFELRADAAPYMQAATARARAHGIAPAAAAAIRVVPTWAARAQHAIDALHERRWLLLAVFGPLAAYGLLRYAGLRRITLGGRAWPIRLLVYGLVALFVVPAVLGLIGFMSAR